MDIKVVIIANDSGHFEAFSYKQRKDFIDHLDAEKPDIYEDINIEYLNNIETINEDTYWKFIEEIEQRGYIETDTITI